MLRPTATILIALTLFALPAVLFGQGQEEVGWSIESLSKEPNSQPYYDLNTKIVVATNGVLVRYGEAVLTADRVSLHLPTGEAIADGDVRVQQGDQLWASQHLNYNFKTHQIEAKQFRTGSGPVFAGGAGLYGEYTNRVYTATNALMTSDDVAQPAVKVRARKIVIIPGKRITAYHATLYIGEIPVFYFPYFTRSLGPNSNHFSFTPGYRSLYGPFILGSYTWFYNEQLDGMFHLDYRGKRGPGIGPDINYNFGPWGEGTFKSYYTHDAEPKIDQLGANIPENRQRVWFSYQANPATNLYLKTLVRYESDPALTRDFFEREFIDNPQPNSFFEANRFWQNFSLDAYVQPQVNGFLETVERLPDVRLTGYRQQLGDSPVYYESETSAGYYRRSFAENAGIFGAPPGLDYEAGRADTFHQLLLPQTFFGWLNVTPRVGGRLTYYGTASGPGATTDEATRGVFNTGAEVSFKVSRLWPEAHSKFFEIDGLRHVIEPSANYVFVPDPTTPPDQLPQFDYELPSLRLLPIDYPDYNAIDSIDSQNVIRWGLRNKLQTKRDGQVVNVMNWDLYTDWRLHARSDQSTFADVYSDLAIRPRSWLTLESLMRYDVAGDELRMSYTTLTFNPGTAWSWRIGQYYLRDDFSSSPTALGVGNNAFTSTLYYRLNENWGLRFAHYFDVRTGRLLQQSYTVYRDLRSWTAALSFITRDNQVGPQDYGVAFTFSLKAYPHFPLGSDSAGAYSLLGL